jgi:hypothetical protein
MKQAENRADLRANLQLQDEADGLEIQTRRYSAVMTVAHGRGWRRVGERLTRSCTKLRGGSAYSRERHPAVTQEMRSEVLLVVTVKITAFWGVLPCSLVDRYQHFGGKRCVHLEGSATIFPVRQKSAGTRCQCRAPRWQRDRQPCGPHE